MSNLIRTQFEVMTWFEEYQGHEDEEKMRNLYSKLMDEEVDEFKEAYEKKDLKGLLDAIGDIFVVATGFLFFGGSQNESMEKIVFTHNQLQLFNYEGDAFDVYEDLIRIINSSNFTKEKAGQQDGEKAGKIIKGDNFVEPDLDWLIEKYNITLKEDVLNDK